MTVKIEFKQGSYLLLNWGDEFPSASAARNAFLNLLNGQPFLAVDDFQGKKLILHKENINSVEVGYVKGQNEKYRK